MKRIALAVAAIILTAGSFAFTSGKTAKKADCCNGGSCCHAGAACCKDK